MWLDVDDIFRNGANIKTILDDMNTKKIDSVYFNYLYQVEADENGNIKNIIIQHLRERIVKVGKYKWVAPIHETLIPIEPVKQIDSKLCDIVHLSDEERMQGNLDRNLKTLEMSIFGIERGSNRGNGYKFVFQDEIEEDTNVDFVVPPKHTKNVEVETLEDGTTRRYRYLVNKPFGEEATLEVTYRKIGKLKLNNRNLNIWVNSTKWNRDNKFI